MTLRDHARFLPTDEDAVVEASFVCPLCLGVPDTSALEAEPDAVVTNTCACGAEWEVLLDPDQALRMALFPPRALSLVG